MSYGPGRNYGYDAWANREQVARAEMRCAFHERYRMAPRAMPLIVLPRRKCTNGGVAVE